MQKEEKCKKYFKMFPLERAVTWILLMTIFSLIQIGGTNEARVVCYYTNWSVYRPGTAKFNPQNINPYLCTHLIYAFGGFTKDNTLKPFDKYQDIEQGGYAKFTGLKTYNKNLKTMLAIGGWNEGSSRFSALVAGAERRTQFAKNIIKFLRQNHFDGLDLDWEYPAYRDGGKPRDKDNYAQLVQELREQFERESSKTGRPRLILTMAVPAGTEYIKKGYDIKKLNKYLDWFNLLSYDYHSAFEPSVNHHAPLYSLEEESEYNYDSDLNIDFSIKFYLNEGADRDKLVLGLPTYGRSYTLLNTDATDIGSPADGPGAQGDATREKGYLAYYEICQNIMEDPDWTVVQPNPNAMGPYAFKDDQWVGYDDIDIMRKKAEYVVANGLGGIMFWSIDNDDFRGVCHDKPYPLIEAAKEAMLNSLGLGDNEVVGPSRQTKPSRQRSRQGLSTKNKIDEPSKTSNTAQRQSNNRKKPSTTTEGYKKQIKLGSASRTTTPQPPTTPDPGADFKCQDEGFFPHPRDCKKYFWCLDSGPSNLGIVAHQFTCPSGLVFNKETDSCDYTRNVVCNTPKTIETPTTKIPSTTTARSKITVATSKTTIFRRPTSTSATVEEDDEEEYDDDNEEEQKPVNSGGGPFEEEDPKVIKELIDLIKKVGGLEELEKQLNAQSDGLPSSVNSSSKSLYQKVLAESGSRSFLPKNRYTSSFAKYTKRNTTDNAEPTVKTNSDNKYSSVIRNSRPKPQNDGLEKNSEYEGLFRERPQYVTINRSAPSLRTQLKNEEDSDEDEDEKISSENDDDTDFILSTLTSTTTAQPHHQYVNIQRNRLITTKPKSEEQTTLFTDDDDADDDEDIESDEKILDELEGLLTTSKKPFVFLNRGRPTTTTTTTQASSIADAKEDVTSTTRYKFLERTRPTTTTTTVATETIKPLLDITTSAEIEQKTTVPNINVPSNNVNTDITRPYANISRKTTIETKLNTNIEFAQSTTPVQKTAFISTTDQPDSDIPDQFSTLITEDDTADQPVQSTEPSFDIDANNDSNEVTTTTNLDSLNSIYETSFYRTTSVPSLSVIQTNNSLTTNKHNDVNDIPKTTITTTKTNQDRLSVINTSAPTTVNIPSVSVPEIAFVSSPRPFGFSKRTRRPSATHSTTSSPVSTISSTTSQPSDINSIFPTKVSPFTVDTIASRKPSRLLSLARGSNKLYENKNQINQQQQVSVNSMLSDESIDDDDDDDIARTHDSLSSTDNSALADQSILSTSTLSSNVRSRSRNRNHLRFSLPSDVVAPTQHYVRPQDDANLARANSRRRFRPKFDEILHEVAETTTPAFIRPLRPTIESDLSSLTAGDFYKYSNFRPKNTSRRIWPARRSSTTVSSVDNSLEEDVVPDIVSRSENTRRPIVNSFDQRESLSGRAKTSTISRPTIDENNRQASRNSYEKRINYGATRNNFDIGARRNVQKETDSPLIFLRRTTQSTTIQPETTEFEDVETTVDFLSPLVALNTLATTIPPTEDLTTERLLTTNSQLIDKEKYNNDQRFTVDSIRTTNEPIRNVRIRNRFRISSVRQPSSIQKNTVDNESTFGRLPNKQQNENRPLFSRSPVIEDSEKVGNESEESTSRVRPNFIGNRGRRPFARFTSTTSNIVENEEEAPEISNNFEYTVAPHIREDTKANNVRNRARRPVARFRSTTENNIEDDEEEEVPNTQKTVDDIIESLPESTTTFDEMLLKEESVSKLSSAVSTTAKNILENEEESSDEKQNVSDIDSTYTELPATASLSEEKSSTNEPDSIENDLDTNNSADEIVSTEYQQPATSITTTSTTESSRRRKVIRRFRPTGTTESSPAKNDLDAEIPRPVRPIRKFLRTRKPVVAKEIDENVSNETTDTSEEQKFTSRSGSRSRSNLYAARNRVSSRNLVRKPLDEDDSSKSVSSEEISDDTVISNKNGSRAINFKTRQQLIDPENIDESDEASQPTERENNDTTISPVPNSAEDVSENSNSNFKPNRRIRPEYKPKRPSNRDRQSTKSTESTSQLTEDNEETIRNIRPRLRNRFRNQPTKSSNVDEQIAEIDESDVSTRKPFRPTFRRPTKRPEIKQYNDEQTDESDAEKNDHTEEEETKPVRPSYRRKYINRTKVLASKDESDSPVNEDETSLNTNDNDDVPVKTFRKQVSSYRPRKPNQSSTRKQNIPYNRFSTTPSSISVSDNHLLDDLDRNALNSRNKKIFGKNNRKHQFNIPIHDLSNNNNDDIDTPIINDNDRNTYTIIQSNNEYSTEDYTNTMSTDFINSMIDEYTTQFIEQDNFDTSTQHINVVDLDSINANELQESSTATTNEDSTRNTKIGKSTTTTKPTTLHHIFAINDDETIMNGRPTEMMPSSRDVEPSSELITQKLQKIAEVSRVVEIYSHQEKRKKKGKSKKLQELSDSSNLVIEQLPEVQQLGEINRVVLIKVADRIKELSNNTDDIPIAAAIVGRPEKTARQIVYPEAIFSVETSTIPLEALFPISERSSKSLDSNETVQYVTPSPQTTPPPSNDDTKHSPVYVRPLTPLLRPESNESSPLVISIANLDQVILSKISTTAETEQNDGVTTSENIVGTDGSSTTTTPTTTTEKVSVVTETTTSSQAPILVTTIKTDGSTVVTDIPNVNALASSDDSIDSDVTRVARKSLNRNTVTNNDPVQLETHKKVRQSYRPNFRRPSLKYTKPPTTPAPITKTKDTTESIIRPTISNRRRTRPTATLATKSSTVDIRETSSPSSNRRTYSRPPGEHRRRIIPTTVKSTTVTTPEPTRSTFPHFRRRYGYTSTTRRTTTIEPSDDINYYKDKQFSESDQNLEPSIQDSKFTNSRFNLIGENLNDGVVEAITTISKAPLPVLITSTAKYSNVNFFNNSTLDNGFSDSFNTKQITRKMDIPIKKVVTRKPQIFTTTTPSLPILPAREIVHRRRPQPFQRRQRLDFDIEPTEPTQILAVSNDNKKAAYDYDYYDDEDLRVVGKHNSKVKVILHEAGIIECLDQGNFPHPLSCRKFISCAKMETGGVVGWEYTCPKGLSYDPVGSMCNWSAGLGCKE